MKTYYKGVTSIVAIFMTLILFSCQDELIEPIDTLSKTTDENLSKKGKPPKGDSRIDYWVSLDAGTLLDWDGQTHVNELISACDGTVNSVQTLLWFNDCTSPVEPAFTPVDGGSLGELNYGAIRPATGDSGGTGEYGLRMTDSNNTNYYYHFEGPVIDLSIKSDKDIAIYQSGVLKFKERVRKDKKWVVIYHETDIEISIGIITIKPL